MAKVNGVVELIKGKASSWDAATAARARELAAEQVQAESDLARALAAAGVKAGESEGGDAPPGAGGAPGEREGEGGEAGGSGGKGGDSSGESKGSGDEGGGGGRKGGREGAGGEGGR
jgi:hypothetical protein